MQHIPCFYHPTTLVLVDDDADFLNSLTLALAPHHKSLAFLSPHSAQQFLEKNYQKNKTQKNKYLNVDHDSLSEVHVQIATVNIHKMVFERSRFDQTVIAIIDYDMPAMNGLELARCIKATAPIKIIMLTGEADQATAVDAFNGKEIDCFILKSAADYPAVLSNHITQLQQDYFIATSSNLFETISSEGHHPLQDPDFIALFHQICAEHHIVEYYLLDESGSFLMLDAAGHITWLIVRTEEDMQVHFELAEEEGSPVLLQSLKNREKIACFPQLDDQFDPVHDWRIHDAIQLANKQIYYCILKASEGYVLDVQHIMSYIEFLQLGD
jgi:CheY-like chemotaxis protein